MHQLTIFCCACFVTVIFRSGGRDFVGKNGIDGERLDGNDDSLLSNKEVHICAGRFLEFLRSSRYLLYCSLKHQVIRPHFHPGLLMAQSTRSNSRSGCLSPCVSFPRRAR